MNEVELKMLERKAIEALRKAFDTLNHDQVLPGKMTFPLGTVRMDIGIYTADITFVLRTAPRVQCDPGNALKGIADTDWDSSEKSSAYRETTFKSPFQAGDLPCEHCGWGVAQHDSTTLRCRVEQYYGQRTPER